MQSELLWRIKDAEELIKSRISETRLTSLIQELRQSVKGQLETDFSSNKNFLHDEIAKINSKLDLKSQMSLQMFEDLKTKVAQIESKHSELATRA